MELRRSITTNTFIKVIDVCKTNEAIELLKGLIAEMGGLDLIVICSGAEIQKYYNAITIF